MEAQLVRADATTVTLRLLNTVRARTARLMNVLLVPTGIAVAIARVFS